MSDRRLIIFCSKGMSSWLIIAPLVKNWGDIIDCVVEFPVIPQQNDSSKPNGLLQKIKSSSLHYLWFNIVTVLVFQFIANLFGNNLKNVARRNGVDYFEQPLIDNDFLDSLIKRNPNYIINLSGNILRKNLLSIPKCGVLNYHGARLPEFRGAANYFWHLVENVKSAQGTLHYVTPGLDEGDVIDTSREVSVHKSQTSVYSLWKEIRCEAFAIFEKYKSQISSGNLIEGKTQNHEKACVRSFPLKSDVKTLFENGFKVFRFKDYLDVLSIAVRGEV